jgi:Hemerythrin HHE cation binding domain
MPKNDPGAVELLEEDHRKVQDLFKKFESAKVSEKEEIANQVDLELRVHSMIEEELLYPSLRDAASKMVAEAFEEHGVVEELLNELATMELGDEQFEAKFKVMQENVEHHIEEEEKDLLPQARKLQNYEDLGMQMVQRKVELMKQLGMEEEPSGRATTSGEPATMRASEKSEAALEGASSPPVPQRPERSRRSRRAAATSGRRSRR